MSIAQKLGYISVMETLKGVTDAPISPTSTDEKYKVVSPETMQETFMSDSEDEGGKNSYFLGLTQNLLGPCFINRTSELIWLTQLEHRFPKCAFF